MTKNTKALLLSTLVCPGLGQYNLKRFKSAFLLIGITVISIIFIFFNIMTKASAIADKIIAGEMSAEYSAIRNTILEQQSSSPLITFFTYLLIAVWLLSVVDILFRQNQ